VVELRLPSPVEEVHDDRFAARGLRLFLKREDLVSPELPGNKWRKLKHNLVAAAEQGHRTLLTFGGAYSNHIRATAAAGRVFGFETIGVIRGEEHLPLNETLEYATAQGMRLTYLDRTAYRHKTDPDLHADLRHRFGDFYLLPEGGSNAPAVRGCAELPAELDAQLAFDVVCCPVGTGGTLAGLAATLPERRTAIGFSVLKGGDFLTAEVAGLQRAAFGEATANWRIETAFHHGGYARRTPELDRFRADFRRRHGLDLDRIYTAKALHGLTTLAESGAFRKGTTIVALITALERQPQADARPSGPGAAPSGRPAR
jgi:1-aminocyclopropane-1-carboxylate deaminase